MMLKSPKSLAFVLALAISLVTALVVLWNLWLVENHKFGYMILSISVLGIFTYILLALSLNSFVISRIKQIHNTINKYKTSNNEIFETVSDKDIIEEVNAEVKDWAKQKALEIKELKEREKYRREFIGNVAHELKTPIFNIQGYILTLLDGGMDDQEINRKYLESSEKNINRLISTLHDIDTISHLEASMFSLTKTNFNITKLLEEVFEFYEMKAADFKIKLKYNGDFHKNILVNADKTRISEVFNNLIENSLKYGKENGTTNVSIIEQTDKILIKVLDNGIGIAEKDLPRIFERFYRSDKSRSRQRGGSGLGLAIVKHIIEAHGHKIEVKSTINEGSTFSFSLDKAIYEEPLPKI
jgi:two-component system phosphate regulon sensor histidine kinase PhoR